MGTRADFYVGIGPSAEWIGSTSYDGHPDRWGAGPLAAKDEAGFRAAVEAMLSARSPDVVVTRPSEGWPWPWNDSRTSDWAYAWDPARGPVMSNGREWVTPAECEADRDAPYKARELRDDEVVDMSKRKMGSDGILAKSGLSFLVAPK